MDTAQHTPGPWGIKSTDTGPKAIFSGESGAWVATTCKRQWKTEDEANARLIAAAPELLAALERARSYLRSKNFDAGLRDAVASDIEAAIYKATGSQP